MCTLVVVKFNAKAAVAKRQTPYWKDMRKMMHLLLIKYTASS